MAQDNESRLRQLYKDMYCAMIAKDTTALSVIMDEKSALVHMTGMRQPRKEYLKAIVDGTLNYYSCEDSDIKVKINGDSAFMTGKSKVSAAVFDGSRHIWPLRLDIDWKNNNGNWRITEIRASTY